MVESIAVFFMNWRLVSFISIRLNLGIFSVNVVIVFKYNKKVVVHYIISDISRVLFSIDLINFDQKEYGGLIASITK